MRSLFVLPYKSLSVLFSILLGLGLAWVGVRAAQASQATPAAFRTPEAASAPPIAPTGVQDALQAGGGPVRLLASDERGLTLELVLPAFEIEERRTADGQPCQLLVVEGFGESDQSGWPRLPVRGTMLGIPAFGEPKVTLLEAEPLPVPGRYELCPVETPILSGDLASDGPPEFSGWQAVKDPQAYAVDEFIPAQPAELASTSFIRSQRVAQLRLQPFQYNPLTGELRTYKRLRLRLDFASDGKASARAIQAGQSIDEGAFEDLLESSLLNYEQARAWRYKPAPAAPLAATRPFSSTQPGPAYKVLVDQDGIYELSYSDLLTAGLPVDEIDPRTFQLRNQGQELAIYVEGQGDGEFEAGEYLLFYGQKINTRYTDVNVYWLTWGGDAGMRMDALDGAPSGGAGVPAHFRTARRFEQNKYYQTRPSSFDGDHWDWDFIYSLKAGKPVSKAYPVDLVHTAVSSGTATVRGLLRGYAATPQHHTRVYLNGHLVDDAIWASQDVHFFETNIPTEYLLDGVNSLKLELPMDGGITLEMLYLSWLEIDYDQAYVTREDRLDFAVDGAGNWECQVSGFYTSSLDLFEVTTPTHPARIVEFATQFQDASYWLEFERASTEPRRYIALGAARRLDPLDIVAYQPAGLRSNALGADYILITHADFYTAVLPLAAYRSITQGLRTAVVDVQNVYDEFSYGVFDPAAIRDFLAYAYANWEAPAPAYVLLVGDGNYDFKNYIGIGESNYIPPFLDDVDPWMGETAADNRYVNVSGDDILPDLHLGRLPVRSSAEAAALAAKILAYEQHPTPGEWKGRALFVADNADAEAGDFAAYSDLIADGFLPPSYRADKIYYGVTHTSPAEAQAAVLDAINQGALLVSYVGHAASQYWAAERLLSLNSIGSLANAPYLPLMAPMTCMEGYFVYPSPPGYDFSSVGESIVRAAGKGAVASWSPTGFGVASGHDYLERGLFQALFYEGLTRLGPATTWAKLYLYANTAGHRELIDTYVLFGDPATRLQVLKADLAIRQSVEPADGLRPGDLVTYTLSYSNTGQALATHVLISDTLPAALLNPQVSASGAALTLLPGQSYAWQVADLAPGEGGVITITSLVDPAFSGELVNTVAISTAISETRLDNNRAALAAIVSAWRLYLPAVFNPPRLPDDD